ncbi:iron-sulfur cluster repair di-iron protein [Anaerobacillus alkalilacustris]|uniref:Iron-sulfur cluster repair di-iron protein n=1 Tax=Anaerobacillus alkalilacustris TaxID=393763 RepID=A0A1S2LKL5_9BACI|nr:iron-sulfur cluster repair di-iron protein [Anaerobacillus alkalilacustris]OIJ13059.1 iron-sulfur cluster repair di-iron protein [Anaerobacillus alkalilacustris]
MTTIFTRSTKTGDIVTKLPAASKVFKQYKIDFCCGGDRPIGEVLQEQDLNEAEILNTLNELYETSNRSDDVNWAAAPLAQLVDHIVNKYHVYTEEVLTELNAFVTKVYRVHGNDHPHLREVYQAFSALKAEMAQHLIDEERDVFPHIIAYEESASQNELTKAKEEIAKLEAEHEAAGDLLKKLREVTNDYQLPVGACNTYRLTYLKLEELETMTHEHIHLENNILFKRLLKA